MSLAQLKIDIKAVFNDLTGKTANVKGDEVATAIWGNPNTWNSGAVKECGDADYTILDDDGFDTFIFRNISANRSLNYPTLSANLGRKIKAILVSTTETLTLDVAPVTDWAAADVITGQTSAATCVVVAKLTALTYKVKSRLGVYTLGEIIGVTGVAAKLADQGATKPTLAHDSYKITQVHEGTDKMNGYASDIGITEWGGWWELTGTATEWRGITDGNSTVVKVSSVTAFTQATAVSTTYYRITNMNITVPPGIWDIYYCANVRADESAIQNLHVYLALDTGNDDNTDVPDTDFSSPCLLYLTEAYTNGIAHMINRFIPRKSIAASTTFYMKARAYCNEANVDTLYAQGDTGCPMFIEARRVS